MAVTLHRLLRRYLAPILFVGALLLVILLRDRPQPAGPGWTVTGATMGTTYTVKLVGAAPDSAGHQTLRTLIEHELSMVDRKMSVWRDDSELQQLNRAGTTAVRVSPALLTVLATAQQVSARTCGAFDITVAPLVAVWGFARESWHGPPAPAMLDELLRRVGWQRLVVDEATGTVSKQVPELVIDLSAIAKGFAVDRVVEALQQAGYRRMMVEIGGEVRVAGLGPGGRPWRVGIELPEVVGRRVYTVLQLTDQALATSGDYRSFHEVDGQRVSHLIDPRTGRPVAHHLASTSVIADSCMVADAWATALSVLGPAEGPPMAADEGLATLFLVRRGDDLEELTTGSFDDLRLRQPSTAQSGHSPPASGR